MSRLNTDNRAQASPSPADRPLRVIHLYPYPYESYYPRYLDRALPPDEFDETIACCTDLEVRYLAGMHALGDRCTLLYPRRFGLPEKSFTHRRGYEIRRFPITWFEQPAGITRGGIMRGMLRYIAAQRPDVVHFQGLYVGGFFPFNMQFQTVRLCRRLGIPVHGWYHIGRFPPRAGRVPAVRALYRAIRVWTLRRMAGIVSINHNELARLFDPASPEYYGINLGIVPHTQMANTYDPDLFHPTPRAEARARLGLAGDRHYLLMASRLFPEKGLHDLLATLPDLVRRFPRLELLVIGEFIEEAAAYRHEIERQIAELGLTGRVRFLGRIEHHQGLPLYYSAADLFVLPTYMDSFAAVNIEALACGTPVVSTDREEIPTYLKAGAGLVVPQRGVAELREAIAAVLSGGFQFDPAAVRRILAPYDYRQAGRRLHDWYLATMPAAGGRTC